MKHKVFLLQSCAVLMGFSLTATAGLSSSDRVPVRIDHLFIPVGFDANDETEVVIDGFLPNSQLKMAAPLVQVDKSTKTITLEARARLTDRLGPDFVVVPYSQTVRIGSLPHGSYTVKTSDGRLSRSLEIKVAVGNERDEFLYAPIDSMGLKVLSAERAYKVSLTGRLTSSCMSWKGARVAVTGLTIQIQPLVEVANNEDCRDVITPFEKTVDLPALKVNERYLVHVRSLNGLAFNQVFTAYDLGDPI